MAGRIRMNESLGAAARTASGLIGIGRGSRRTGRSRGAGSRSVHIGGPVLTATSTLARGHTIEGGRGARMTSNIGVVAERAERAESIVALVGMGVVYGVAGRR